MAHFITETCTGCTLCAKNCPVKAITGTLKTQHQIDPATCIDCGVCGKLCPVSAIRNQTGTACSKLHKAQWKKPAVDPLTCVGCSVCVENCPVNCLIIEPPKFHGDIRTVAILSGPDQCIGCGICAAVCPIEAIVMA